MIFNHEVMRFLNDLLENSFVEIGVRVDKDDCVNKLSVSCKSSDNYEYEFIIKEVWGEEVELVGLTCFTHADNIFIEASRKYPKHDIYIERINITDCIVLKCKVYSISSEDDIDDKYILESTTYDLENTRPIVKLIRKNFSRINLKEVEIY